MEMNAPSNHRHLTRATARAPQDSRKWQPALDEPLRGRALAAAELIAGRLRDPDNVVAIAATTAQQSTIPMRWRPTSIAFGFAGIALAGVYFACCFPHQGWETLTHHYLRLAAAGTQQEALALPNFLNGTGGLATILSLLDDHDARYHRTRTRLNAQFCKQVRAIPWRRSAAAGVAMHDYDVVNGAAGVLGYLVTIDHPDDEALAAIEMLLEYLIWLAGVDETSGRERWFIPPELLPNAPGTTHRARYPHGYFDCGLAHGIPGPLASLASAWLHGYRLPGHREAMHFLSDWIIQRHVRDTWGINWPAGIPLEMAGSANDWRTLPPAQAAWCYGAPGIARALWLAGTALDNDDVRQAAIAAIEAVLRRPAPERGIFTPSLCHGLAGLLTICLRFAHETPNATVHQQIPLIASQLLDAGDPESPLGFREQERAGVRVDHPGWLNGTPGIALALLAAATSVAPDWDHALLIS